MTRWVNQHLSRGGYTNQLVTDLAEDMADGITLLRLVQTMAMGERGKSEIERGGRRGRRYRACSYDAICLYVL